jgi:chorismate mutase/prephenate dehydratase
MQPNPPASPPPGVPPTESDLALLRAEIDRLDDALHELVMQRAEVVARLSAGRAKGSVILRRLLARHAGPFPRDALVQVWRTLINGNTALQGPFGIAVFNTAPGSGFVALAREHFGATTPARAYTSPAQVLAAVSSGEASVGVLPMPGEEGESETWWTALMARDQPRIHVIARLPFWAPRVEGAPRAQALVVGAISPEPSGSDRTMLGAETTEDLSRARITMALAGAGLVPRTILTRRGGGGGGALLVEVEGFCAEADPRLARFAEIAGTRAPVIVGAYATVLEEVQSA